MAAAFDRAGFEAVDVHMSDVLEGRGDARRLPRRWPPAAASPTATCWARARAGPSPSCSTRAARDEFAALLRPPRHLRAGRVQRLPDDEQPARAHPRRRATGRASCATAPSSSRRVCAGGHRANARRSFSAAWPAAACRSRSPTARAAPNSRRDATAERQPLVALRYVDNRGKPTERYPYNPNGSPGGITGLTTPDGRFTILMPHPERVFRTVQNSWHPDGWGEDAPWMRMFRNARKWVGWAHAFDHCCASHRVTHCSSSLPERDRSVSSCRSRPATRRTSQRACSPRRSPRR